MVARSLLRRILWIHSTPARPARSIVLVVDPHMTVRELLHSSPREWSVEMIENITVQEDIPPIQSLI